MSKPSELGMDSSDVLDNVPLSNDNMCCQQEENFICIICNVIVNPLINIKHFSSYPHIALFRGHAKNTMKYSLNNKNNSNNANICNLKTSIFKLETNLIKVDKFICPFCFCIFTSDKQFIKHILDKDKFKEDSNDLENEIIINIADFYKTCEESCHSISKIENQTPVIEKPMTCNTEKISTKANVDKKKTLTKIKLNQEKLLAAFDCKSKDSKKSKSTSKKRNRNKKRTRSPNKDENLSNMSEEDYYFVLFINDNKYNICHQNKEFINNYIENTSLMINYNNMIYCMYCKEKFDKNVMKLFEHIRSEKHWQYYLNLVENNKTFADRPDEFSTLKLGLQLIKQIPEYTVYCFACRDQIGDNNSDIQEHISSEKHITLRTKMSIDINNLVAQTLDCLNDTWYNFDKYWCSVCNEKFISELSFAAHIKSKQHKGKINNLNNLVYEVCIPCSLLWITIKEDVQKHLNLGVHKYNLIYNVKEMPSKAIYSLKNLESCLEVISQYLKEDAEKNYIGNALIDINNILRKQLPTITMNIDETRFTKISIADIIVILNISGLENNNKNSTILNTQYLEVILNVLSECEHWDIQDISNEYIQIYSKKFGIECKINVTCAVVENKYKTVRLYLNKYFEIKLMIRFLKHWMILCELDIEQMNSYIISWLVIFYFQTINIFPTGLFAMTLENTENNEKLKGDIKLHLKNFFKFYATFDYKSLIISPFLGKPIQRSVFAQLFNKINESKQDDIKSHLKIDSPFIMQDPVNIFDNITHRVTKSSLKIFRYYCRQTSKRDCPSSSMALHLD